MEGGLLSTDLTRVYTAADLLDGDAPGVGQVTGQAGGKKYIFLLGVASTVAGDVVTYNASTGVTARAVANAKGPIAVAMAATVASTYGWYQIEGLATVNVSAAVATNSPLYLTATAGSVDDTVVAGDLVAGMFSAAAAGGAGTVTAWIQKPFVTDTLS